MAAAMFYMFGPESHGGRGNFRVKIEEEVERSGRTYQEVAVEVGSQVVLNAFSPRHSQHCRIALIPIEGRGSPRARYAADVRLRVPASGGKETFNGGQRTGAHSWVA